MNETLANESRRRFFSRDSSKAVLEVEASIRREMLAAKRLLEWERAFETDLLALGPEMLMDMAHRMSGVTVDTDYSTVAKELAKGFEKVNDER
jgi:hypothetical protein